MSPCLVLALSISVIGYRPLGSQQCHARSNCNMLAGRGFGKLPPPSPPPKRSADAVRRDRAANDFDALKSSGAPEYTVMIRTVGEKTSEWMPVGGIAGTPSCSILRTHFVSIFLAWLCLSKLRITCTQCRGLALKIWRYRSRSSTTRINCSKVCQVQHAIG